MAFLWLEKGLIPWSISSHGFEIWLPQKASIPNGEVLQAQANWVVGQNLSGRNTKELISFSESWTC
ncbi:hypothetical protein SDJN02_27713, partial [Cucurbita argyrosperma subsp. argyrosperma]